MNGDRIRQQNCGYIGQSWSKGVEPLSEGRDITVPETIYGYSILSVLTHDMH
jgi:hypothetical protein